MSKHLSLTEGVKTEDFDYAYELYSKYVKEYNKKTDSSVKAEPKEKYKKWRKK